MSADVAGDRRVHVLAGLAVSGIGLVLLAVPVYDIYDDVTSLSWSLVSTAVENVTFVALAGGLVGGGVWLSQLEWEPEYVALVGRRTVAGTGVVVVLVGFVVFVQETMMGALKPYVIAMDAVLIGAATSFGLGVYSAKAEMQTAALTETSELNHHLETLHEYTSELETADDREAAYAVARDAIGALFADVRMWVVVDGDRVVDTDGLGAGAGNDAADSGVNDGADTGFAAPIGDHGRVVLDEADPRSYERETVELLGVHLGHALDRIDRQDAIYKQRERLEFVNRTVRHNLLNDVNVVSSRLQLVDPRPGDREHYETVVDRVDGMGSFIQTMRQYTNTIAGDGPDPRPVALKPALATEVESVRDAYPEATVSVAAIPDVAVLADELLGPVFENPLTNALEHHDREAPTVEVTASVDDAADVVVVAFADDGPGIADDRKDRVFEQGHSGGMTAGTGFGLYLVKDVVESYGGSVAIRDSEPRGTVVELRLPLADEP